MEKLKLNLEGKHENHILPFLWMHGETEEVLRAYMEKIEQSGIRAVCVEARPHPEFVKEKWWEDMDVILDEAKKRGIQVWILDDSHFPTGYAAGEIKSHYPQYRKRYLKLYQLDFAGPLKNAQALIRYSMVDSEDRLEGIYLAKKTGLDAVDASTITDITECVQGNNIVRFNLPQGEWKMLALVSTVTGGEKETEWYLNPLVPEAVDVLIRTVYESHYEHYKEEFGRTISGFFSDEPRFGNIHGFYGKVGRSDMVLPWRDNLAELLTEEVNGKNGYVGFGRNEAFSVEELKKYLPLLFVDGGTCAHIIRYHYMNLVSRLYSKCFSERIGDWCHAHGVSHIGHVIEDNNTHARLGYGDGHFFRAMKGQDMAGIDVVLHQLMPGMDHGYNKSMTALGWDGEFFHYVLAKLGASLGHFDQRMAGRVMCEVFGAYGWAEGNRMMKWIADHMLVRGVNEFVPHAFDPKEYPDPDCPPHFYAHGKNPQFQDFQILMDYINRMSTLLSDGVHRASVAVLYHGEAEWSGQCMLMQKPCAELARTQIDYDIIPGDYLADVKVKSGEMYLGKERFQALVISEAEAIPAEYIRRIAELVKKGLRVYAVGNLPERSSEGEDISELLKQMSESDNVHIISLSDLADSMRKDGIGEIRCMDEQPYLRNYHYEQPDGHVFMFVNEMFYESMETEVMIAMPEGAGADLVFGRYDPLENVFTQMEWNKTLQLNLAPGESAVFCMMKPETLPGVITCAGGDGWRKAATLSLKRKSELSGPFEVSFIKADSGQICSQIVMRKQLIPIQEIAEMEDFCGVIRYETEFECEEPVGREQIDLVLEQVYEGARVNVNGSNCGVRICPPYRFRITDAVHPGTNCLKIEVTTTLERAQQDRLSQYMIFEPTGITERIVLERYTEM